MVELTFRQKPSPSPPLGHRGYTAQAGGHSPDPCRAPALLSLGWRTLSPGSFLCHLGLLPVTPEYEVLRPVLSQPKYLLLGSLLEPLYS